MTLVVEDGSIVANANSYVTLDDARAYAAARNVDLSAVDDDVLEGQLVLAMDYLEAQRARYQGYPVDPGVQMLQWPRYGVRIDCRYEFPTDAIPVELKNAQMQLNVLQHGGVVLYPSSDGRVVKREKVDVIETEYMTGADLGTGVITGPIIPSVDALLAPLFNSCGGTFLKTVRV